MKRLLTSLLCLCSTTHLLNAQSNTFIDQFISIDEKNEPSFDNPISQLATQNQFMSPKFLFWCEAMKEPFRFHRKVWEFCYVAEALDQNGMLKHGKRGLGFGVGSEPLPALFASYGCSIVATDQDFQNALKQGWVQTDQHLSQKSRLNDRQICHQEAFDQLVELSVADMNHIDPSLRGFDFTWSCCCLEHLGNIEAGLRFIINSMDCLNPGGVAVHTTEYNLSSNRDTFETPGLSIYRKSDIARLVVRLKRLGYEVAPLNLHRGNGALDYHVDLPPYKQDHHLKLRLNRYDCTSIGIIVKKPVS